MRSPFSRAGGRLGVVMISDVKFGPIVLVVKDSGRTGGIANATLKVLLDIAGDCPRLSWYDWKLPVRRLGAQMLLRFVAVMLWVGSG